jgi:hypothetical protein
MLWARMVAYVTGMVNQELLVRNEFLGAENRILRGQIKGRLLLSEGEKATLAEIAQRLGRKAFRGQRGHPTCAKRAGGSVGVEVRTAGHVWQTHI